MSTHGVACCLDDTYHNIPGGNGRCIPHKGATENHGAIVELQRLVCFINSRPFGHVPANRDDGYKVGDPACVDDLLLYEPT